LSSKDTEEEKNLPEHAKNTGEKKKPRARLAEAYPRQDSEGRDIRAKSGNG